MKVNIGSILEIRGDTISFEGLQEVEISDPELELKIIEPVVVRGTVTNTGKDFLVQAVLSFKYQVNCGRCLEKYGASGEVKVQEAYINKSTLDLYDESLKDDPVFTFTGDVVDLQECIQEQVFLALPMSFVCRDECKGLCPICGQNFNIKTCNCSLETINPQFESLKVLLSKEAIRHEKQKN